MPLNFGDMLPILSNADSRRQPTDQPTNERKERTMTDTTKNTIKELALVTALGGPKAALNWFIISRIAVVIFTICAIAGCFSKG